MLYGTSGVTALFESVYICSGITMLTFHQRRF
jgi:hypothetical protein